MSEPEERVCQATAARVAGARTAGRLSGKPAGRADRPPARQRAARRQRACASSSLASANSTSISQRTARWRISVAASALSSLETQKRTSLSGASRLSRTRMTRQRQRSILCGRKAHSRANQSPSTSCSSSSSRMIFHVQLASAFSIALTATQIVSLTSSHRLRVRARESTARLSVRCVSRALTLPNSLRRASTASSVRPSALWWCKRARNSTSTFQIGYSLSAFAQLMAAPA